MRFHEGDLIEGVQAGSLRDARRVTSTQDLLWILSRIKEGESLTLWVYRDENKNGKFEDEPDYTERFRGKIPVR